MANPHVPDLGTPGVPDAPEGPVPPDNQPGHHPRQEQDTPDLDAFATRLGVVPDADGRDSGPGGGRARMVALALVAVAALALFGVVVGRKRRGRGQ